MRGRKPAGPEYIERLPGSAKAKARAKVVLETLAGRLSVAEACRRLGIGEAFFHRLRKRFLQGGVPALEDRPAGRRPRKASPAEERMEQLETDLQQTRLDLQAAQLREEIALTMPHLLHPPVAEEKKRSGSRVDDRPGGRGRGRNDTGDDRSDPARTVYGRPLPAPGIDLP